MHLPNGDLLIAEKQEPMPRVYLKELITLHLVQNYLLQLQGATRVRLRSYLCAVWKMPVGQ